MTGTSSSATGKNTLLPAHIAIVPDSNGRWAGKRGLTLLEDHREAMGNMYRMVEYMDGYDIPYLIERINGLPEEFREPTIDAIRIIVDDGIAGLDLLLRTSDECPLSNSPIR